MPRVFVLQDNGSRDFSKARRFGSLVPVLQRDVFPDDAQERSLVMKRIIVAKILDFNQVEDHFLLTGDPVALLMLGLVLRNYFRGGFNVLKWDRENNDYYPVHLEI